MTTSNTNEKKNPWDALFASVTRPIAPATNLGPPSGGYVILIQHSITSEAQRSHALASTLNSTNVVVSMANMNISKTSTRSRGEWFGMSGPFLTRRVFDELCIKCEGVVVFVSLLGNSGVVDLDELQQISRFDGIASDKIYEDTQHKELNKRKNAIRLFKKNGAVVDLATNPFGWDDQKQIDSEGFVTTSTINNLQSIADAVRAAAAVVESRRATQQRSKEQSGASQRPIPIIFDSMTPLLGLHGAQNVSLLLQNFKQSMPSQSYITSPIVAPILYESIRPSDHRLLEDVSDSFMSLELRDDINNNDAIRSGVLDIVRQGGGALGGKLMRGRVPVHIMRASESSKCGTNDLRDRCYWILEHNDEDEKQSDQQTTNNVIGKEETKESEQQKGPRIYLDANDPEFEDFDEEDDIDDDLDL